jgi:hypothetical protein
MKPQTLKGFEARLMHFLEDLLEPMGHRTAGSGGHWRGGCAKLGSRM